MTKLTKEQQHDFVADVTRHLLEDIKAGVEVFAVLSFRHDLRRDTMQCTHSTIKVGHTDADDRMSDRVAELVEAFMDANASRWSQ